MIRRPPRSTLFPTRRSSDLQDPRRSLETFRILRGANLALLKSLPRKKWRNYGMHAERGKETIARVAAIDRKSTRLNSSHSQISYAVFCLKKKKKTMNLSSAT